MTGQSNLFPGEYAELMCMAMRKNRPGREKGKAAFTARQRISSFEEYLRRNAAPRACYVYINGISMPVLQNVRSFR